MFRSRDKLEECPVRAPLGQDGGLSEKERLGA